MALMTHRAAQAELVLALLVTGCPPQARPMAHADAATDRPAAAPAQRTGRRRHGRHGAHAFAQGAQGAQAARTVDPSVQGPDDSVDEGPPPPRPRIAETGPMLPEDLGPPPAVAYDMASEQAAPMGLGTEQVSAGFNPLLPRFTNCAAATTDDTGHGPHGRVHVRVRVRNDGHPIAARVSGGGGPPEFLPCVRRVVAAARFAHFGGPDVFVEWGFDVD